MSAPTPAPAAGSGGPDPAPTGSDAVDQVRAVIQDMRAHLADAGEDLDLPEVRFVAAAVRLIELVADDDAAGVEAMNARTQERADRIGGDGHTWVMHRREWAVAQEAAAAWRDGDRG